MVLILVGALTLPVLWRTLLQAAWQAGQCTPFFHASRTSLLVLFVLAVIYMKVATTAAELMPWLTSPGLWPAVARIAGQSMQVAMLAVVLTSH
jgi:hypothetical protein